MTIILGAFESDLVGTGFHKPDGKALFRPQRRQKFHHRHPSYPAPWSPILKRLRHFFQNHYARHNRIAGKMPRQAGMIGDDYLAFGEIREWLWRGGAVR